MNCLECGKETKNPKFCNRSCSAKYNNRKYPKRLLPKSYCLFCGGEIVGRKKWTKQKYCSLSCSHKEKIRITNIKIENGEKVEPRLVKRYLKNKRGHKCSICGRKTWMGKQILLILDHVDGNPYNNTLDNLRLVCSNCDAQLPTYKGKNTGNGRHYRRERYSNGKSY